MKPDSATNSPNASTAIYSAAARHFHWLTLALILVQFPLGIFMSKYGERTDFAPPTAQMYDTHKLLGLFILLVVVLRLSYRVTHGAPPDEPTLPAWQKVVSHLTHWLIYAMLIIVPVVGWLAVSAYGPFQPFGFTLPALIAQNEPASKLLFGMHKLSAVLLLLLIAAHIGAALFHYFIRKDGVLNRMWTSLPRRTRD